MTRLEAIQQLFNEGLGHKKTKPKPNQRNVAEAFMQLHDDKGSSREQIFSDLRSRPSKEFDNYTFEALHSAIVRWSKSV